MVLQAKEERDHVVCDQQRPYVELHQSRWGSVQVTEFVPMFVIYLFFALINCNYFQTLMGRGVCGVFRCAQPDLVLLPELLHLLLQTLVLLVQVQDQPRRLQTQHTASNQYAAHFHYKKTASHPVGV